MALNDDCENPWNIGSIYELQYFNCPRCEFKDHTKQIFINHAFEYHHESVEFLTNLKDGSLNDVIINIPATITGVKSEVTITETIVEIDDSKPIVKSKKERPFECKKCGKTYSTVTELTQHILELHHKSENQLPVEKNIYQCQECNFKTSSLIIMKDHININHLKSVNEKLYQCQTCNHRTETLTDMKDHIQKIHKTDKMEVETNIEESVTEPKKEGTINRNKDSGEYNISNDEKGKLVNMMATSVPDLRYDYTCKFNPKHNCGLPFQDKKSLGCHYTYMHNGQKPDNYQNLSNKKPSPMYLCHKCDFNTMIHTHLKYHMKTEHKYKPKFPPARKLYQCHKCSHRAEKLQDMKDHMKKIHKTDNFVYKGLPSIIKSNPNNINFDGNIYKDGGEYSISNDEEDSDDSANNSEPQNDLNLEHILDKKNSSFKCTCCNFAYSSLTKLKLHFKNVHENKKQICDYCEKSFIDLQAHIDRVHKGIKNHECKECGKAFFKFSNMKDHIDIVHKKMKPFQCNVCPYKAINNGKLNYHHKRVHGNVRSHPCDKCDKVFKAPFDLRRHISTVHDGVRPFACNMCSYKASKPANLNRHLINVHKSPGPKLLSVVQ